MRRKTFNWKLPAEIEARLGDNTYGHQRAIAEADHILLVLHTPPDPATKERDAWVFLRRPDGTLLWNGQENGKAKLEQLLHSYRDLFEKYDEAQDHATSAADLSRVLDALVALNRASTNLATALQSARDAAKQDRFLLAMRDEAYEMSRSFELLFSDTKLALDFRIAQSAELQNLKAQEMATAQHKLNLLAAATFPLMAVATVFGMNLLHGFEDSQSGFWVVLAIGFLAGIGTMAWVTRHTGASLNAAGRR